MYDLCTLIPLNSSSRYSATGKKTIKSFSVCCGDRATDFDTLIQNYNRTRSIHVTTASYTDDQSEADKRRQGGGAAVT